MCSCAVNRSSSNSSNLTAVCDVVYGVPNSQLSDARFKNHATTENDSEISSGKRFVLRASTGRDDRCLSLST